MNDLAKCVRDKNLKFTKTRLYSSSRFSLARRRERNSNSRDKQHTHVSAKALNKREENFGICIGTKFKEEKGSRFNGTRKMLFR